MTRQDKKSDRPQAPPPGTVFLVGAGPGDPGLITVAGLRALQQADVVVYDALANPRLLDQAPAHAQLIDAGKRAGQHKLTQDRIHELLAEHALAGKTVVRLKGGDPYVFGRGSEEAIYLHSRGIPVVVIPGVTSAVAGPAYAGIPLTHRNLAATCTFVTGHEEPAKEQTQIDYPALAALIQRGGTVCFYMGMGRLPHIAAELQRHGCAAHTPAAVVQWGTLPTQRSLRSTLSNVQSDVERAGLGAPSIIVVGPVAALNEDALNWFERRPLFGQTIIVTRTRQQASELRAGLEALGANVIEAPTIAIDPPQDWSPIEAAMRDIQRYDWLVLTSVNGVAALAEVLHRLNLDARHLAGVQIAAVGPATALALNQMLAIVPDLVPDESMGDALADKLLATTDMAGKKRILMLRADIARPSLVEKLSAAGAKVDDLSVYRTRIADALPDQLLDALREHRVNWLTFTSSSTARNFVELLPDRALIDNVKIASIGPSTSQTIRELGLALTLEAPQHDIPGLIDALLSASAPPPPGEVGRG